MAQNLYQAGNKETKVSGHLKGLQTKLFFHSDYQNSTLRVSGIDSQNNYGFRYNAFGVVSSQYQNGNDEGGYSASSIHTRTNNLIPYQYTGKYRESISGFNHMDARWYNPTVGRFIQPDQYNHVNLMLPKDAQSELMRYIGRTQSDLLKDPAQQMRYGYVSGNALRWVDPLGLCEPEDAGYVGLVGNGVQVVDPSNMYANPGNYVQPLYFSDDSNLIYGYSPETDVNFISIELEGNAGFAGDLFGGFFGTTATIGQSITDSGQSCTVSSACVQIGLGAHIGGGGYGSGSLSTSELEEGESESWGPFLNVGTQGGAISLSDNAIGLASSWKGPGYGISVGLQFCESAVTNCSGAK
ncbi:hypothetical protein KO489_05365 [Reinekea forsetii]|nr:hypothetical protein [Reinekea forsetii]